MKLSLSANISKLRKEHAMTPELNLIAEMADLFGVSLDVPQENGNEQLLRLWKKIAAEESYGGRA